MSPLTVTNLAVYRFAPLENLPALRQHLLKLCQGWKLKGTILLSPEGINLFIAGGRSEVDALIVELEKIPGLAALAPKLSESDRQPFARMLVRIKKEIIAFGVEGIEPGRRTSPKLPPQELKRWLDEGREVVLLDTRNDYEVKLGTFRGAKVLGIDHFREFPKAVAGLPASLKETPVVMFCTGGIRCEKAGPYMEREGFKQIFQLDGGILKYFEEVGSAHYDGECFVFDHRVGVDPALSETEAIICFVCQHTLDLSEQEDARYVRNVSCPYCYKTTGERMLAWMTIHQAALEKCTHPLPGSRPHLVERPFRIPPDYEGRPLLSVLEQIFPNVAWAECIAAGHLLTENHQPASPDQVVHTGERYLRLLPVEAEPEVNAGVRILHEDRNFVVVDKPATLPLLPDAVYKLNTLQAILSDAYAPEKLQPAPGLSAAESGLVICGRSRHFAKLLPPQPLEITWLLRVAGDEISDPFFTVQRDFSDGSTLLEMQSSDVAVVRSIIEKYGLSATAGTTLHAWKASFTHPITRSGQTFQTDLPAWAKESHSVF